MISATAFRLSIPRQHGAWAMLATSWIVGVAAAGRMPPAASWYAATMVMGFAAVHAWQCAIETRHAELSRALRGFAAGYAGLGAGLLGLAAWAGSQPWLPVFALLAAVPAAGAVHFRRVPAADCARIAGITLATPAMACAAGHCDVTAWLAWLAVTAHFLGSLLEVRWIRRARHGSGDTAVSLLPFGAAYSMALAAFAGVVMWHAPESKWLMLAVLPSMLRLLALCLIPALRPDSLRQAGLQQFVHAVVFLTGVSTLLWLSP